jgi:hypothetical protein
MVDLQSGFCFRERNTFVNVWIETSDSPINPGVVWFCFPLFPTRWYYDRAHDAQATVRLVRTSSSVCSLQHGRRTKLYLLSKNAPVLSLNWPCAHPFSPAIK